MANARNMALSLASELRDRIPNLQIDEFDFGFTLTAYNPDTDVAIYLLMKDSDAPPAYLPAVTALLGGPVGPGLAVRRPGVAACVEALQAAAQEAVNGRA